MKRVHRFDDVFFIRCKYTGDTDSTCEEITLHIWSVLRGKSGRYVLYECQGPEQVELRY